LASLLEWVLRGLLEIVECDLTIPRDAVKFVHIFPVPSPAGITLSRSSAL